MKRTIIMMGIMMFMAGIPAVWSAPYPTGQATVTQVTPFNGIAKYYGLAQEYVNEYASGQWGIRLSSGEIATKATIGAVKSSGQTRVLSSIATLPKAASASIAGIAIQAGLMVGAYYLDEYLSELEWGYEEGHGYYDTNGQGELPANCPAGSTKCWDGEPLNGGATVGDTGPCFSGEYAYTVCEGIHGSWADCQAACPQCSSSFGHSPCAGWHGFGTVGYQTGSGEPGDPLVKHFHAYAQESQPHLVPVEELMGLPPPLTSEEIAAAIQATLDAHTPPDSHAVWDIVEGALAQVAPYVNESNKDFPVSRNEGPLGSLSTENIGEIQDALDAGIDPSDAEQVEDQNATAAGDTDWEYTPDEMAKAQYNYDKQLDRERKAEYDTYENTVPDYNATITLPEKDSLTSKLENFMTSLTGSEIKEGLDTLKEVGISGGVCTMSVDLGDWGEMEFSFCEWENGIEALGAVMLAFSTFAWGIWFFMGRGD